MANKRTTEEAAAAALDGTELLRAVQAAGNVKVSISEIATFVQNVIVDGAPGALDTLNELAAALGDDANFASTVTTALALKAPLASPALTGTPTAPTATVGTSTTQLATTAFVAAAVSGVSTTIDDSAFEVIEGTTPQTAFASTDAALLNVRTTGLRSGGAVSINADTTKIDISAGVGAILDNTDPANPTYTRVTFAGATGLTPAAGVTYWYVDGAGAIQSTATAPTAQTRRTRIWLAQVSKTGGVVSGFASNATPTQQLGPNLRDLADAIGPVRVTGATVSAASTNLTVAISAGAIYSPGTAIQSAPLAPNYATVAATSPTTFRMFTQTGPVPTDVTTLPVGFYDVGGTVTAIPGASTRTSIFEVRTFPGSTAIRIGYGQAWYSSLTEAVAAISTRSQTLPAGFDVSFVLGWIVATKGATNLADPAQAVFVASNKFGAAGGGAAAATTTVAQAVNTVYAGPATGADATPSFRALVAADIPSLAVVLGPFFGTTPTASETLHVAYFDRNVKLTAGLASSKWTVETNPAATFVLTLRKNGTSIGTVSFSTAGAATVSFTSDTTFTAWTDKFSITAPGTADTTVAGISVTLKFDPV